MSLLTSQNYGNDDLVAGRIVTRDDAPLAADTYYRGMPLVYTPTVTADGGNTGDGTLAVVGGKLPPQDIVFELTAALVGKITVGGSDVVTGIALTDGGTKIISYRGFEFAVTDGATPFASGDKFTVNASSGTYAYSTEDFQAIYLGPDDRTLASAGQGSIVVGGNILKSGLVDGSNSAITVTDAMILNAQHNGINLLDKAS